MTTQDKTGDKLVASIRKTKAGAAGTTPPATRKKTAATRRTAAKPQATEKSATAGTAGYQSPGRVWPD